MLCARYDLHMKSLRKMRLILSKQQSVAFSSLSTFNPSYIQNIYSHLTNISEKEQYLEINPLVSAFNLLSDKSKFNLYKSHPSEYKVLKSFQEILDMEIEDIPHDSDYPSPAIQAVQCQLRKLAFNPKLHFHGPCEYPALLSEEFNIAFLISPVSLDLTTLNSSLPLLSHYSELKKKKNHVYILKESAILSSNTSDTKIFNLISKCIARMHKPCTLNG